MNTYGLSPNFSTPNQPASAQLKQPSYVAPKKTTTQPASNYVNPVSNPYTYGSGGAGAPLATQAPADPLAGYQDILNGLNSNTNNYFDQLGGFYQQNHDITANELNAQNTQALGTQDQGARDSFLNQVYNPLMKQQGAMQYKYGLDTGNNDALFGLQSTANQQNRDLALNKLATDEQNSLNDLGLKQGNQNESTLEDLNSRGLLYGQSPTGGYQPNAMGGMHGLANQQAGLVNQDFQNQRNEITQPYNLNVQGANQAYTQQQGLDTQNHLYNNQNYAYDAANGINTQNTNYNYQTGLNNNQLETYKAQVNNQKQQQLQQNFNTATSQAALKNGYGLYGK